MKQIATLLLIPILVGVILLLVEHKVIAPSEASPMARENYHAQKTSPSATPELASTVSALPTSEKALSSTQTNAFQAQITIADLIYGTTPRNTAYVQIIERAIQKNNLTTAVTVAEKLYGTDIRNDNYDKIINKAIELKQLDLAEKIASEIYGSNRRNAGLSRVLAARAAEQE
jgi:hypothetical protein